MPSSIAPLDANSKPPGSAAGSRSGSAVGSSFGLPRKTPIDDIVREYQFCSEYTSHYKPFDPRYSNNMQAAGRDILKMAIYGEQACKRETPVSMVSACSLASKTDGVQIPPRKSLQKNRSSPSLANHNVEIVDGLKIPRSSYSAAEDQEGSVAGWRGLLISGYRGPRAPIVPRSELPKPGNVRDFQSTYSEGFHGRMPQGPGRAGNSSITSPLTRDDLENWQQALEDERRRLKKDRAAVEKQQEVLAEQRARMKDALGFSGAN